MSIKHDAARVTWTPAARGSAHAHAGLPLLRAMRRGAAGRCPVCGEGRLFSTWLGVVAECTACGTALGRIPADDAPPYFTVFIVAHVVIGLQIALERSIVLPVATELMIFLPGTLLLTLALIRPVKGATVGMMLKLGFAKPDDTAEQDPAKGSGDA
jgi:uncharacterized protein (DUF983 family)